MSCKSYNKSWESEFHDNVSAKQRVQDINFNQLKLKVNDIYEIDEKITKNFEPTDDSDVINKAYIDEKLSKKEGQISYTRKSYDEFKLHNNKQSVDDLLNQRVVKKTIQKLYGKGLFDDYNHGIAY